MTSDSAQLIIVILGIKNFFRRQKTTKELQLPRKQLKMDNRGQRSKYDQKENRLHGLN
jgi:hypothetical protein